MLKILGGVSYATRLNISIYKESNQTILCIKVFLVTKKKKKLMKVLEVQIVKFLPGRTITDSSLANFIQKSTSSIMPSSSGRFSFTCYQKGEKKTLQMFMLKHKSHSLYIRPYHCNHGPIWFVWTGQTRDFLNSII